MALAADILLCLAAVPALLAAAYLLLLTLASGRRPPPAAGARRLRFDIVVPAHDEEAGIAATVRSLLAVDWPAAQRRVLVVADNCSDGTAAKAGAAGATVLVRTEPDVRGKGHALAFAFERCLADGTADAVVVVDADTLVSPGLLQAYAVRLEQGAAAVQAHYGVRNAADSWRTRLMAVAFSLFHGVRSLGRERLGLSCGLRGNGMCFAVRTLREVPHRAFSVVEDLEYGICLVLAGKRVRYAAEAEVLGDMVSGETASRSQRNRWEVGRRELVRQHALPLLARGLRSGDPVLLDLAADLLVPPLASLGAVAVAGLAAAAALSLAAGHPATSLWAWVACLALLLGYVARGVWISGLGWGGVRALAFAPAYLAWKGTMALRGRGTAGTTWIRTQRERRR